VVIENLLLAEFARAMTGRFVLKIGDHLENAEKKKYYNERVFSEIAPRFGFTTQTSKSIPGRNYG
jgi:hypothetical protein